MEVQKYYREKIGLLQKQSFFIYNLPIHLPASNGI